MTEFQKWCQEMLPIVQAGANGEEVEYMYREGEWGVKTSSGLSYTTKYRIKPKTIRIGEYDVPAPVREPLEAGTRYYTAGFIEVAEDYWTDDYYDQLVLSQGLVHLTKEAAETHTKALLSFTAKPE